MKPLLLLLTAGLLCNLWPFSSRSVQRNAPAYVPQTTMEKLEAHVWTDFSERISDDTHYNYTSTFILFKNNIMYSRWYHYDDTWGPVVSEPFYFYTPGVEDKTDTITDYETHQLFYYDRIGQAQNGKHVVYDDAALGYKKHRVYNNPIVQMWDSIIFSPPTTGFTLSVKSFDIITLSDYILAIKTNTDFTNDHDTISLSGRLIPQEIHDYYTPTDKPFPWDENLKKYYRKMPIIARPPAVLTPVKFIYL